MDKKILILNAYQMPPSSQGQLKEWRNRYHLSPLHQEVIFENEENCLTLLKQGKDPNSSDCRCWTPLHHAAALRNPLIIRMLLDFGAKNSLNSFGGSYKDILRIGCYPEQRKTSELNLFFRKTMRSELVPLTAESYQELTLSQYMEEPYISSLQWVRLWQHFPFLTKGPNLKVYDDWKKAFEMPSSPFLIAPLTLHLTERAPLNELGLFAMKTYFPFEFVGEYIGEIAEEKKSNYSVGMGSLAGNALCVDAEKFSNALSRINDGFPNLFLNVLRNLNGIPKRAILVTLQNIFPGEQFCFHYGWHETKKGPYIEIYPKALRTFVKTHEVEEWKKTLQHINPLEIDFIDEEKIAFIARFRYVLQTPKALSSMILDGTISFNKALSLISLAYSERQIPEADFLMCQELIQTSIECRKYYLSISENHLLESKNFLNKIIWVLETFDIQKSISILKKWIKN